MALFQRYNNEDILMRAVIAGSLNVLNNNIQYNQIWGNDPVEDKEIIKVPWYYNQSGDERFMQDFYTHYAQCLGPKPVDGNFDMIPRGTIQYTGSAIDSNRITSRYVQGRYVKEVDGKLEGFISYLYSIPLDVKFDAEIWVDNFTTALKIEQEIREIFFKNVTYYVYYKGMKVGCTAGFPEDIGIEKNIQYSFESDTKIKLTFSLAVETYQPIFDPTTEMPTQNQIKEFTYRLYDNNQKNDGAIRVTTPKSGAIIPKGNPLSLEWIFTKEEGIMKNVDFFWTIYGENELHAIDLVQPNQEYYIWNIPKDFTDYQEPNIIWEETETMRIIRKPEINIVPDLETKEITAESFIKFSDGYFGCPSEDASINIQLEMKDELNNTVYTPDGAIWANIRNNVLDSFEIDPSTQIFFPGVLDYKHINLHIANSVNNDHFGIMENIKIV